VGLEQTVIRGLPDSEKVSTSYVEHFNLSSRMQMRRFTRLTNGFSKKLENHQAAMALWIAFLQSLPRSQNAALHASNGAWRGRSHLDDC
jgi:hypothetical protein